MAVLEDEGDTSNRCKDKISKDVEGYIWSLRDIMVVIIITLIPGQVYPFTHNLGIEPLQNVNLVRTALCTA